MGRLSLHVEGDAIGSLRLNLKASYKQEFRQLNCAQTKISTVNKTDDGGFFFTRADVIEVLVKELKNGQLAW